MFYDTTSELLLFITKEVIVYSMTNNNITRFCPLFRTEKKKE